MRDSTNEEMVETEGTEEGIEAEAVTTITATTGDITPDIRKETTTKIKYKNEEDIKNGNGEAEVIIKIGKKGIIIDMKVGIMIRITLAHSTIKTNSIANPHDLQPASINLPRLKCRSLLLPKRQTLKQSIPISPRLKNWFQREENAGQR